jgi:hypothetical protein
MRDAHGKTATFADELRCIEPARDAFAVERRRHHDKAQVGTQVRLHVERERGAEVAVQVAFVEFIEEDRGDAGQFRVVLDHAREDAFGDDFDARRLRDLRFEADAVADRFADTLAALRGHEFCRRARGDATRFEQQDAAVAAPRRIEQRERHARGFACARRRLQHEPRDVRERREDLRQQRVDGCRVGHAWKSACKDSDCRCRALPKRAAVVGRFRAFRKTGFCERTAVEAVTTNHCTNRERVFTSRRDSPRSCC